MSRSARTSPPTPNVGLNRRPPQARRSTSRIRPGKLSPGAALGGAGVPERVHEPARLEQVAAGPAAATSGHRPLRRLFLQDVGILILVLMHVGQKQAAPVRSDVLRPRKAPAVSTPDSLNTTPIPPSQTERPSSGFRQSSVRHVASSSRDQDSNRNAEAPRGTTRWAVMVPAVCSPRRHPRENLSAVIAARLSCV